MIKTVELKLVVVIDGQMIPLISVDYSESIGQMIDDGIIEDNNESIVEHIMDEYNDGNCGI
jgi:Ser-tRNA(Ala) deacylase AlaX